MVRLTLLLTFLLFNPLYCKCQNDISSDSLPEFKIVDKSATPKGGYQNFYNYIAKKISKKAKKQGLVGKIYVEFLIQESGYVDQSSVQVLDVELVKKLSEFINPDEIIENDLVEEEVIEIIKSMPKWTPAERNNEYIKQRIIIPLIFKK